MKYSVKYWDDTKDCSVREVIVEATNIDEAEERAAGILTNEGEKWVVEHYPTLIEPLDEDEEAQEEINQFKKEVRESGIEEYLHEHIKDYRAQRVLARLCEATLDRLSEEDRDALTEEVLANVEDDLR